MISQVDKILNCMNTFFFFIEYCKSKVRGPQISIFPYSCQFRNKCKLGYQFSSIHTSKWTVHTCILKNLLQRQRPQEIIYAVNNWWSRGQVYMFPQSLTSTPISCTEVYINK